MRKERKFPARTFQEALGIAEAIQKFAAGQKVRRLTLFEKLDQSPDTAESKRLITSSGQYGLTKGSYASSTSNLLPRGKKLLAHIESIGSIVHSRTEMFEEYVG